MLIGVIVAGYWYGWAWTGLNASIGPQVQQYQPGKTLWDWMQLLIIPAVLAIGALLFNRAVSKNDQEIATDNQQEATLQEYLNRMSELLLEKNLRASKLGDDVRTVARARTLTALHKLDGIRKGSLLQFLYEAKLISGDEENVIIHLQIADLDRSNLTRIFLNGVNLTRADLNEAILYRTILTNAILELADLKGANLRNADLIRANLSQADLSSADLSGAIFIGANLSGANLRRALLKDADLRSANLQGANVTMAQLNAAKSLESATMPNGSKHS